MGGARTVLVALALAAGAGSGCQTVIGNYFANRARDFGECWRVEATLGPGLGGGVRAGGLAHVGLGGGVALPVGVGIVYGDAYAFGESTHAGPYLPGRAAEIFGLVVHADAAELRWKHSPDPAGGHVCFAILPAFAHDHEQVGSESWIWRDGEVTRELRWARVHAFDIEASAWAFFAHARVGFSPGEFVDFVFGWFGLDIAGDDRALATAAPGS